MKRSKKRARNTGFGTQAEFLLTETSPFAIQEAYKTIRTNIIFSIPDEKCKKILVTSALQGEAKSTTAVNLGIAFVPDYCIPRQSSDLFTVQIKTRLPKRHLAVVTSSLVPNSPVVDAFLSMLPDES